MFRSIITTHTDISDDEMSKKRLPVWAGYALTAVMLIAVTIVLLFIQKFFPLAQYPFPYILVVMLAAYYFGRGPAILAFLIGIFFFIYFFVPPFHSLYHPARTPGDWAAIAAFILGASIIGVATIMIHNTKKRVESIAIDLLESHKDMNRAQSVSHTGSWRLDIRQDRLLWSDESYRIFGIPVGTPLTYETFLESVHPDDKEYVDRMWMAALNGEPYNIEHRIVSAGAEKWVREIAELDFDRNGKLKGGFGTVQDITELKRTEEALKESEERFYSAFEYAAIGIALVSPGGRFLRVNHAFCKLIGYTKEELLGKTFQDITYPDDLELDLGYVNSMLSGDIDAYLMEKRYIHKEGHVVWVSLSVSMVKDDTGKPLYFISQIQDVTEKKQAEKDLSEAKDTAEHNVYLLQRALIPAKPQPIEGYTIASAYIPAYAGIEIGGDFMDVFNTESGKTGILIGDVSGKGIESAALAAITRSTVRAFAYDSSAPGDALSHTNSLLSAQQSDFMQFVTSFLVILDPATGEISYSSAGHPPAIISGTDSCAELLCIHNMPLGINDGVRYDEGYYTLKPGDKMVFYTDGVTEARYNGDLFGTEGIRNVLLSNNHTGPDELVQDILNAVKDWTHSMLRDDTAILIVKRDTISS